MNLNDFRAARSPTQLCWNEEIHFSFGLNSKSAISALHMLYLADFMLFLLRRWIVTNLFVHFLTLLLIREQGCLTT